MLCLFLSYQKNYQKYWQFDSNIIAFQIWFVVAGTDSLLSDTVKVYKIQDL